MQHDLGLPLPNHGSLDAWTRQGVFLLNTVLTVEAGQAGSHQGQGWETFTDTVISLLNEQRSQLVFLLWGSPAQAKARGIDTQKHLVLKAPHPSPFSAQRGFFGCKHFSRANAYLKGCGVAPVDWTIPPLKD